MHDNQGQLVCSLCGSACLQQVLTQLSFSIYSCAECGLGVTLPQSVIVASHYDISPQFAQGYSKEERRLRGYAKQFLQSIKRYTRGRQLLDIGCSVGVLVEEASKLNYEAEGLDLDSHAVEYGLLRGRRLYHQSIMDWPVKNYDVICMSHTLEHIQQPLQFLSSAVEHIKDDGFIAVVVPCYVGLNPCVLRARWYGWMPAQHYFHYSPKALALLFQKVGVETVRIQQESMDHRPQLKYCRRWQDLFKSIFSYILGSWGSFIGKGDQLVAIGRVSKK